MDEVLVSDDEDAPYPWGRDKAMRQALEEAGWRYAYLIGLVEPDTAEERRWFAEDRERFKAMLAKRARPQVKYPLPQWWEVDAIEMVHALTGQPRETCQMWLAYDWP